MRTISNGARVGVLVQTWTDQGVPYEAGYGVAQRGHAEMFLEYEVIGTDVHLASSRTLSLTLLAIGHLPRH